MHPPIHHLVVLVGEEKRLGERRKRLGERKKRRRREKEIAVVAVDHQALILVLNPILALILNLVQNLLFCMNLMQKMKVKLV
jgi:hypothetical protein